MTAKCAFLLASLLACAATPLAAQSLWPRPVDGSVEFGAEWVRPTLDEGTEYGFTQGVWIFDARFRVRERLNLTIALPRLSAPGGAEVSSTGGGTYFGIEITDTAGRPAFSLGLRTGGADLEAYDARELAQWGDFDRIEQTQVNGYTITGIGHTRPWQGEDGGFAELRFGGALIGGYGGEGGMYFDYGVRIGRDGRTFGAGFAWTGRWNIGSAGGVVNAVDQLTLDAALLRGPVRPSLGVRIPFDEDLNALLDYALIFGLRIAP